MASVPNLRDLCQNACVACRSKKVRCMQGVVEGTCERCRRLGALCVQPPPRGPRKSKVYKAPTGLSDDVANRIRRLEENLEHVTSELATQRQSRDGATEMNQSSSMQSSPVSHNQPLYATPAASSTSASRRLDDVLERGLLSQDYAEALVDEFRTMCRGSFPYVVLPPGNIVASMRRDSPMLLLAILSAASWRDRPLQNQVETFYMQRVGQMMVTDGEQTLDLLQSLLIHMSWSHWHMKSAYRLNYFTAAIVANLGINRLSLKGKREAMRRRFEMIRPGGFRTDFQANILSSPEPVDWPPEAKRAYIGSYVISRSYSLLLRRYDGPKYNETLEQHALTLAADNLVPSDSILIHYVRLLRYGESVGDMFGYGDMQIASPFTESSLQFMVKSFDTQLTNLWASIPISHTNDVLLGSTYRSCHAYTYEIGLHTVAASKILTSYQTTLLLTCLESVKSVLDLVSTKFDRELQTPPGYIWARLHYYFLLAVELTLGVESPSWDVNLVHSILRLEDYLDDVCEKLDRNACQITTGEGTPNWFSSVSTTWRNMRTHYMTELGKRGIVPLQTPIEVPQVNNAMSGEENTFPMTDFNAPFMDFGGVEFMPQWYGNMNAYGPQRY